MPAKKKNKASKSAKAESHRDNDASIVEEQHPAPHSDPICPLEKSVPSDTHNAPVLGNDGQTNEYSHSNTEKEENEENLNTGDEYLTASQKIELESWATDEEIREAYRKFSRLFHPDKHTDSETQDWASAQFLQIQEAYEVLINPTHRAAYDVLGVKPSASNLEVGSKLMSKEEIRQEFDRNLRLQNEKDLSNLIGSKSDLNLVINSYLLTSDYFRDKLMENGTTHLGDRSIKNIPNLLLKHQLETKHSFMIPLGPTLSSYITTRAIISPVKSSGNVGVILKHTSARTTTEISLPVLPPYTLKVKRSSQLGNSTFYNITTKFHKISLSTPPTITATYGQSVSDSSSAFLKFSTGNQYCFGELWDTDENSNKKNKSKENDLATIPYESSQVSFTYSGMVMGDMRFDMTSLFSVPDQKIVFNVVKPIDSSLTLTSSVSFGAMSTVLEQRPDLYDYEVPRDYALGSITAHLGGNLQVNEYENYGYAVSFGINAMTTLQLSYRRLGQNINVPILLSPILEIDVLTLFLLLPTMITVGVNYLYLRPKKLLKLRQRISDLEVELLQKIELQKKHSIRTKKLLEPISKQKQAAELKVNGLVIQRALYGDISTNVEEKTNDPTTQLDQLEIVNDKTIDVTDVLMALVNKSQLVIPAPKNGLQGIIGFYNPLLSSTLSDSATFAKDHHYNTQSYNDGEFFSSKNVKGVMSHLSLLFDSLPTNLSFMKNTNADNQTSLLEQVSKCQPKLLVEYMFKGKQHVAIINNSSSVILPLEGNFA
ncbi:hypothetical protein BB561_003951 [Smittium simulii]|uniref:J domain-containing protein n=1 Tax=Smittium simulii TaxID=133385 RepID=A0A2T9YIV4_9FUNG|nr:hypothetical protein BB561_003951 [Smittium simulii]